MSRLNDILDSGLYTDSEGKADYRTGKVSKEVKALMLELIDNQEVIQIPSGRNYGHWVRRNDLREKVQDL
jgi:hypothetical protein